jgi:MoaA/NifB/PqqE/SkfB family radical SAM enzyme
MHDLLSARPQVLIIEVTSKCNLRCAYCPKSDADYDAQPYVNRDLSDAALRRLYEDAKALGIAQITISGVGETAMFSGWHERLADFLDDRSLKVYMVSNMVRVLDDADLNALCKLHHLQVSFDSADPTMVRKLRSNASLRSIIFNIVRLRAKKDQLGYGPTIIVNCTTCRENIGELAGLARLCRVLGIDRLNISAMISFSRANPFGALDEMTDDERRKLAVQLAEVERILAGSGTAVSIDARVSQSARSALPADNPTSACLQPWNSPLVRADGRVIACCINTDTSIIIGDLAKQSYGEIIEGDAAREVRQSILNGHPITPCAGCTLARGGSFAEFRSFLGDWFGPEPEAIDSVAGPAAGCAAAHLSGGLIVRSRVVKLRER